ncbi:MAG: NfeD family protein [Peptococcaceae bacterium]|jgi:membrane protein implicated in regulation of membrane protease activity|nr:NfeD family protein [Peptococcaceae bacterium]
MVTLYWISLAGGLIFTLVSVVFGDFFGDFFAGFLEGWDFCKPVVIVSAITVFGGAGIMLTRYTQLPKATATVCAVLIAIVLAIVIYFVNVRPMKNAENSIGYSMRELVGKIGTVTVPLPERGFGEVLIKSGIGNANHIASSSGQTGIPLGSRVQVVAVENGVLQVMVYVEGGE